MGTGCTQNLFVFTPPTLTPPSYYVLHTLLIIYYTSVDNLIQQDVADSRRSSGPFPSNGGIIKHHELYELV